ncbi:MAG: hypothetical protein AB7I38_13405 [Dehalococcoidia bacterium]
MARHRSLSLARLQAAIPPDVLERFFSVLPLSRKPEHWVFINPDALATFLDDDDFAEENGRIRDTLQRINDIAGTLPDVVFRSCSRAGLQTGTGNQEQTPEAVAMQLYVESPRFFDFAWSQYILLAGGERVGMYDLGRTGLDITEEQIKQLQHALSEWYASRGKGGQCLVSHFPDSAEHTLLIQRGQALKTMPLWVGPDLSMQTFRPALEDVLTYEPLTGTLRVKASQKTERQAYVRYFAGIVAGDIGLADAALASNTCKLGPFQTGDFHYGGAGSITRVWMVSAVFSVDGAAGRVSIDHDDVVSYLSRTPTGFDLSSGNLRAVRLRFEVDEPGSGQSLVTVYVQPPDQIRLADRRYEHLILEYLREQEVRAR